MVGDVTLEEIDRKIWVAYWTRTAAGLDNLTSYMVFFLVLVGSAASSIAHRKKHASLRIDKEGIAETADR